MPQVAVRMNLEVSAGEAWFPELERVCRQERMTVPRTPEPLGVPLHPGLTLRGWDQEPCTALADRDRRPRECAAPATGGTQRPLSTSPLPLPPPSPPGHGDTMDTETGEQGCKATSFPSPPAPPLTGCIVTIHLIK